MTGQSAPGAGLPSRAQLLRAFRLLNRSLADFYEQRYGRTVELCGEALAQLLPPETSPSASPEQKGDLFLRTYSSILPVHEAEGVAGVFTFFQNRKARFHFRQGAPLPKREWWQFLRIQKEEADGVLRHTRLALSVIEERIAGE